MFSRSFVDVCTTVFLHVRTFCVTLRNSSVVFEGVLTNQVFWTACVGSQEAFDWIHMIRSNKSIIKECINAMFSCDSAAMISSISRLLVHGVCWKPLSQQMQKDTWLCASLAIVLENCVQAGDMIGVITCCCSMTGIASSHKESTDKLLSKVISKLNMDDEDGTNRIPSIIDTLFQVSSILHLKAASSAMSYSREYCEQAAQICDQIFAPLLQGIDDTEKQIEHCSRRFHEVAGSVVEVSNMSVIAENWAKANRSQIFEAISSPLPQLNDYTWTNEAFVQAWTGLKMLSLLCASTDSEIVSVIWISVRLLTAGSATDISISCPEFHRIFMRCSCGSRNFNFLTISPGIIPLPDFILSSAESCQNLCQTFHPECSVADRTRGISDFTTRIVSNPTLLTVSSSFLHLRSFRKLLSGSFGSALKFLYSVGHVNVLRLSLLLEKKFYLEAIFLLKHFQSCCLTRRGSNDADVALVVDFCVAGLISLAIKALPSVSSPSSATLLYTVCSCSSINRSLPLRQFSQVMHAAISAKHVSEMEMELAVSIFNSVFECFGKSFTVDVESYSASVMQFFERCRGFLSDKSQSVAVQGFDSVVHKLIDLITPVLRLNPRLLGSFFTDFFQTFLFFDNFAGSVSMLEANKTVKSQVKSLSLELVKSTFDWIAIRSSILDTLNAIVSSNANVAAHCCLALAATVSFSLRLKQLLQQNSKDSTSVQLLVANLFTIGCSGIGDSGDILHSICNAGSHFPSLFCITFVH